MEFKKKVVQKSTLDVLKKSWWFAWISAAALLIGHLKEVTESIDRFLIVTKWKKPDAIVLSENTERAEIGRSLVETAWRQLFWARSFHARVDHDAKQSDVDEAWKSYIAATETWTSKLMLYVLHTERFCGKDRALELEIAVQKQLNEMNKALVSVRYSKSKDSVRLQHCKVQIDEANSQLYHFVRTISPPPSGS